MCVRAMSDTITVAAPFMGATQAKACGYPSVNFFNVGARSDATTYKQVPRLVPVREIFISSVEASPSFP
jgi:hypothetical protein